MAATSVLVACGQTGIIEADWQFVDRRIEPIYPGGGRQDACALDGQSNGTSTRFDLRVRIVAESIDGAGTTVESALFDCDRARGAITDVPEGEYRMSLEVWLDTETGEPFRVSPHCVAAPGPRDRAVTRGRITDLSVWQFVAHSVDLEDSVNYSLNLDDCERSP
jgi:hypothetical protein